MNILICKTLQKAHKPCCYSDNSLLLKKSLKTAIAKLFERFSFFCFWGLFRPSYGDVNNFEAVTDL